MKSVGHNISHSLASGIGLLIGHCNMDIFGEAASSDEGFIIVDFVNGTSSGGRVSSSLAGAISAYAKALPDLCLRHGLEAGAFRKLTTRYFNSGIRECFVVTVEDHHGRRSEDEYCGSDGTRAMVLDQQGRIRPKRSVSRTQAD
nr:hypothetical protein [uncultured Hyphomonas sp.]